MSSTSSSGLTLDIPDRLCSLLSLGSGLAGSGQKAPKPSAFGPEFLLSLGTLVGVSRQGVQNKFTHWSQTLLKRCSAFADCPSSSGPGRVVINHRVPRFLTSIPARVSFYRLRNWTDKNSKPGHHHPMGRGVVFKQSRAPRMTTGIELPAARVPLLNFGAFTVLSRASVTFVTGVPPVRARTSASTKHG